jgi:hypothetical protein
VNNPSIRTCTCVPSGSRNPWTKPLTVNIRPFRRVSLAAVLASVAVFTLPRVAAAQGSAVPARVTERVDTSRLVTLKGNTHPLARAQYDQGAAPPDLPMNRMLLILKRSADQEAALQNLLVQQQTKGSPNFHKWLTPDLFGQQFGPADADIQAVTSWLASYGFQSIKVSRGRTVIEFSGTAAQIQAGLHTTIHRYVVNGQSHWANSSDPQIPAALAPVVSGVVSMHDFRKKPASHLSSRTASLTLTSEGKPQMNFSDNSHGIAPADFDKIYNVPTTLTGTGYTIAVVARTNINPQDVADFRSQFGLPANFSVNNVILDGPDPGDLGGQEEAEAVLDASWSGAIAPGATVDLVVSEPTNAIGGEDLSEFYIIDNNLADVMTESFENCELAYLNAGVASSAVAFYGGLAEQAAAEGITYSVAAGDGGPDACDDPSVAPATTATPSVNILASTPFTVAVGGTEFHDCDPLPTCVAPATSPYWLPTNDPTTKESAASYLPENVWNESCLASVCGSQNEGLWSSGGGESDFIDGFFEQPPWQSGVTGIPTGSTNGRFVPDVSFAAADHDGYVLCLDASCQGVGCPNPAMACYAVVSGTSVSAQVFGGVMALIDQNAVGRQGQADYVLYNLAATENSTLSSCNASNVLPAKPPASTCIFNDVTSVDVTPDVPDNTNIPGPNNTTITGFPAAVGYDEATGLGSLNVGNLASKWSSAITQGTNTTIFVCSNPPCVSLYGSPVTVTVTVTPVNSGQPTPTGDVSLIANLTGVQRAASASVGVDCNILPLTPVNQGGTGCNNVPNNSVPVGNNGVNWNTTFLPGGTYPVHAHYAGDGTFLGSDSSTVTVTINPTKSITELAMVLANDSTCTRQSSLPYGSQYALTVAVVDTLAITNGISGTVCAPGTSGAVPTGTVTVTDGTSPLPSSDGGSTFKLNSFGYLEDQQIPFLAVGTHNIQAAYGGDNSFQTSSTTAPSFTVTKTGTTPSITSSPSSVAANAAFSVTVLVDTKSVALPPTGIVTVYEITGEGIGAIAAPFQDPRPKSNPILFGEVSALLAGLTLLAASKKRRSLALLAMSVLLVIAVGTSCGSSSSGGGGDLKTITLGTANVTPSGLDANGFVTATATVNNLTVSTSGNLTATYGGDGNYNVANSAFVAITVH